MVEIEHLRAWIEAVVVNETLNNSNAKGDDCP